MSSGRTYGSEYEKRIFTESHPQPRFEKLDAPDYIAESKMGVWLATRWEELVVVVFLASVALYCSTFYIGLNFVAVRPFSALLARAWDVAVFSIAFTSFAPVGRKLRKRAKKPLFALFVAVAAARWWNPSLYPSIYPWQPRES